MSTSRLDLRRLSVVDNHAHALTRRQPESDVELRAHFTEAHAPQLAREHVGSAVYYRWALRQLAGLLGVEPSEGAILRRRGEMGLAAYARHLAEEARITWLLLDEGFPPREEAFSSAEMEQMLGVRVGRILRLEALEQSLILQHATFREVVAGFDAALAGALQEGFVALKSIAAYRTGLQIEPVSDEEAERAFGPVRREAIIQGTLRLASKPLIDHFVLRALRFAAAHSVPVQFHTGYGDPDLDLRLANPLHLRPLFEEKELSPAPIVLLHGSYPFTAEAAYLAAAYPNAYLDLAFSLPPLARLELRRMAQIAFGVAPAGKIMCSSDGTRIPEHYWLGAMRARQCLADVLGAMVDGDELSEDDARELAGMALHDNAVRVYRLQA
ncbi:MAG: amidohydrolase family protein [Chloroflexi bacterium]|nr:amidohydrolase family protein [Chloroflexota bacterium]